MDTSEKKKLLLAAVEDYELYSISQRAVLKILINVAIDNVASVNISYLTKAAKLSRASIYAIMKQLENDNFIERMRIKGTRHDCFKVNKSKLDHIINIYHNKNSLL